MEMAVVEMALPQMGMGSTQQKQMLEMEMTLVEIAVLLVGIVECGVGMTTRNGNNNARDSCIRNCSVCIRNIHWNWK